MKRLILRNNECYEIDMDCQRKKEALKRKQQQDCKYKKQEKHRK